MPEKQIKKKFYQIAVNGRLFYKQFQSLPEAKKFTKTTMFINSTDYVTNGKKPRSIKIYQVEQTLQMIKEL